MKTVLKFASLILLVMLVFVPLQPAAAKGLLDGQVIFGQSYTLKTGETLQGDLVVFGGSADIEEGAQVNGSVILIGGKLVVNGEVTVDVAIIGGSVSLGAGSHVGGDLTTVGATLERAEGSQVDGQITNAATSWVEDGTNGIVTPRLDNNTPTGEPNISFDFHPLSSLLNSFSQAIGLAVLAMLVAMFLAPQVGRVAQAVTSQPVVAGSLGLLTVIVTPIVIVLLCVTILLIPVAVIAILALVVASVFGWIALGYEIGLRFTKAIHQEWHPALSAGLGTFALSLVTASLTGIPVINCIGWPVSFLLGMAGLGGIILTRFGMQVAVAPAKKTAVVPVDPSGQNPT